MAVKAGTIVGVTFPDRVTTGIGTIQKALVSFTLPAYTATTDSFSIAGVGAAIESYAKRGKTNTLLYASFYDAGRDATGTAIYPSGATVAGACGISTDAVTGGCKAADLSTEASIDSGGLTVPCRILVGYTEA
jgi:hypothetical protein